MKIAFLTETQYRGRWPSDFSNARTEVAWQIALNAEHYPITDYQQIHGYDWVMVIFPKGSTTLSSEGLKLIDKPHQFSDLYAQPVIETLKKNNKKVATIQEGPAWYVNNFSIPEQFNFYNQLSECDAIFAHNEYDRSWYRGWFPNKNIPTIPTLLIEERLHCIPWNPENKTMIGGAFCRWYGGFQSYLVASEFNCPIYTTTSHCTQPGEDQVPNLTLLPRMIWIDWMKCLSTFKYGVNLMPTIAAGTFSLNCAYFGIPCIGNGKVDTQRICFPDLAVDPENVIEARELAQGLKENEVFYKHVSETAKQNYKTFYSVDRWKEKMYKELIRN